MPPAREYWEQWVQYQTQYQTTGSSNTVWLNWLAGTQATAATTVNNYQDVWGVWANQIIVATNVVYGNTSPAPVLTEEQKQERLERERERQEQAKARLEAAQAAKEKARELLISVLDEEQKDEMVKSGVFHVTTRDGERVYRLRPGSPPCLVKSEDGRQFTYCIHPRESLPQDDTTAALKLLLETDEDEFLKIANATYYGRAAVVV